jgi:hypothetical protein
VFVLVHDVEVDRLRLRRRFCRRRDADKELFDAFQAFARLEQGPPISGNEALFDQALGLRARDIAEARNRDVEPLPRAVGSDLVDRFTLRGRDQSPPASARSRR